jgi:predicted metal-dependent phosphoesterase TrpH
MKVDLHCHTTASDGSLSPRELVARAKANGIDVLSITDHDTVDAYSQLSDADRDGITIVPGIEFSTQWKGRGIHIVGLNLDLDSQAINEGVTAQKAARIERSVRVAEKLTKVCGENPLSAVQAIAGASNIGRPHFAQHLVNLGIVKNFQEAFKKHLGAGKAGDVKQMWAELPQIIEWIRGAGGTAVIAHPNKYKLTRTKLLELIADFQSAGGEGIEIVSGRQIPSVTRDLHNIIHKTGLLASCGSDFHHPNQTWSELGEYSSFPDTCPKVWDNFSNNFSLESQLLKCG